MTIAKTGVHAVDAWAELLWLVHRTTVVAALMLDEAHSRHPGLPIAVSEYGAGGALTQHTDDAAAGHG